MDRDPISICNGSDFDFEPYVVSYWSQWLRHRHPLILVVGQDFGDKGYFIKYRGRDQAGNATNKNLRELLRIAGIEARAGPEPDEQARVFLTNAILCLKNPPMNKPIRARWVRHCANAHLGPLVLTLQPPVIVGLGGHGWSAVRRVMKLDEAPLAVLKAAGHSWTAEDGRIVFAVGHCGPLGRRNRQWDQQLTDWRRIGGTLSALRSAA